MKSVLHAEVGGFSLVSLEKQASEPRLLLGSFVRVVAGRVDPAASAVAGMTTGALVGVELPARARKELPPRTRSSDFTFAWCLRVVLICSLFLGCCLRLVAILGVFQRMLRKVNKPQT